MKIVIDARMIRSSGIGRYLRTLLPSLLTKTEHEFVLLGKPDECAEYAKLPNVKMIKADVPVYHPKEHWMLKKLIPPCDIYFSPHFITPIFKISAKRRITTIHDVFHLSKFADYGFLKTRYIRFLIKNALKCSGDIITVSEFSKNEILFRFRLVQHKNISVIHNAVDTKKFIPVPERKTNNPFRLLYVGNVKPHKNILRLMQAFRLLKFKAELLIVGKKEGFITDLSELKEDNIPNGVCFTGTVSDEELLRLYQEADALIFPSLYEGFGLPPLEAMACETPAVVSDIPVLREVCGDAAIYCDPLSPQSIAEVITTLLQNPDLQMKLKKAGNKRVKQFSVERFQQAHLKLFFD